MAEKEIKITFAGEKLEALSFFLAEQGGKTVGAQVLQVPQLSCKDDHSP